ncbi:MAG: KamA family radical SAM protein [Proteobacteria bacterium]|nr:KamA family radical SAM protein [Pseudomonadota bacterium]MBU1060682.1 KamA family radical SAM protein [Pseudomonadota bacterium]
MQAQIEVPAFSDHISGISSSFLEEDGEPPGKAVNALGTLDCLRNSPATIIPFPSLVEEFSLSTVQRKKFRRTFFPHVTAKEWNSWHWQVANRIRGGERLGKFLQLSPEEQMAANGPDIKLPLAITPYYLSLLDPANPLQPLRRTVVPTTSELVRGPGEADDPLGEENQSPVPGLVHRYPDRALFLVHDFCSTYCRYCTRSRVVGHGAVRASKARFEQMLDYIRRTKSIRDVLLSGGDPLLLADERLEWLLKNLRQIPHVEIIRIGTKVPAVLPQRITPQLVKILRRYHPLWMSLHFIHPDECTTETVKACTRLADAGIPLGSQTVLLRGINDNVETMKNLTHSLMRMRVRPYYLYQCDPITGSAHFRTPVEKGLEVIQGLRGFTSGYAVPTYVIDAPGGGGKIPLLPESVVGKQGTDLLLRNYEDRLFRYPDVI